MTGLLLTSGLGAMARAEELDATVAAVYSLAGLRTGGFKLHEACSGSKPRAPNSTTSRCIEGRSA